MIAGGGDAHEYIKQFLTLLVKTKICLDKPELQIEQGSNKRDSTTVYYKSITTASRTAALARGIKSATLNCVPLKLIERSTVSIKSTVIVSMERLCGEWRWRLTTLSINPSKSLVDLILPPSPVTLSKDNGQKENVYYF